MAQYEQATDIIALLQDIGRRSQQQSSASESTPAETTTWDGIGFKLASQQFLIPLDHAREVLPLPAQITSVPKAKPWVHGVANLRGDLLPIIDLQHFFYGKSSHIDKHSRIIVMNHPEIHCGLLVDVVFGLKHFPQSPQSNPSGQHLNLQPYMQGFIAEADEAWYVLHLHQLADDPRFLNAAG